MSKKTKGTPKRLVPWLARVIAAGLHEDDHWRLRGETVTGEPMVLQSWPPMAAEDAAMLCDDVLAVAQEDSDARGAGLYTYRLELMRDGKPWAATTLRRRGADEEEGYEEPGSLDAVMKQFMRHNEMYARALVMMSSNTVNAQQRIIESLTDRNLDLEARAAALADGGDDDRKARILEKAVEFAPKLLKGNKEDRAKLDKVAQVAEKLDKFFGDAEAEVDAEDKATVTPAPKSEVVDAEIVDERKPAS